jgi:beta-glucosidase/6-phospho-beta-glucosidase/beta-galactosidase
MPAVPLEQREADYHAACEHADEVMPRWVEARARGHVPAEIEREATDAHQAVKRAAAKLDRTRRRSLRASA